MKYDTKCRNRGTFALLMRHISVFPIIYNDWIQSDGKWQSQAYLRISTLNRWSLKHVELSMAVRLQWKIMFIFGCLLLITKKF